MQSANEFANRIRALPVLTEQFSGLSALIRARDGEIVEACMLVAFMHGDENEKETMRQGFLSVLRDLG